MAKLPPVLLMMVTLTGAALGGVAFHALGLPPAFILRPLAGAAVIANLVAP